MEETFAKVEELASHINEYVNIRVDTAKLEVAEKTSSVLANLIAGLIVGVVFLLFFLFVNFSIAYALAGWLGKTWAGFLIVAGFYLLMGLTVWVTRQRILQIPIMKGITNLLFNKENEDEED
jgi:xanthosine utilization system XapX-like protein